MKPPGLILAGGLSRRMGMDKATALLGPTSLAGHIVARLRPQVCAVAVNAPFPLLGIEDLALLPDSLPGRPGPLAGVLAGLEAMRAERTATHLLSVPVDSPFFPTDLALRLGEAAEGAETIAIAASAERDHPVFGLWPVALAQDLRQFILDDEKRSMRGFLNRHDTRIVDFPFEDGRDPFFNINTPDELQMARGILERGAP